MLSGRGLPISPLDRPQPSGKRLHSELERSTILNGSINGHFMGQMFIHFPVRYVNVDQGLNIMQLKSCFHLIFHGAFGGNFRSVLAKRQQSAG